MTKIATLIIGVIFTIVCWLITKGGSDNDADYTA